MNETWFKGDSAIAGEICCACKYEFAIGDQVKEHVSGDIVCSDGCVSDYDEGEREWKGE